MGASDRRPRPAEERSHGPTVPTAPPRVRIQHRRQRRHAVRTTSRRAAPPRAAAARRRRRRDGARAGRGAGPAGDTRAGTGGRGDAADRPGARHPREGRRLPGDGHEHRQGAADAARHPAVAVDRHRAADAGPQRDDGRRGAAQRPRRDVQRRRRRPQRRQHHDPRLLGGRRPLPRHDPRRRTVQPRHVQPLRDRRAARLGVDAVRPRLDRRRRQPGEQVAVPDEPEPGLGHRRQLRLRARGRRREPRRRRQRGTARQRDGDRQRELPRGAALPPLGCGALVHVGPRHARRGERRVLLPGRGQHARLRRPVLPRAAAAGTGGRVVLRPDQRRLREVPHGDRHRHLGAPLLARRAVEERPALRQLPARPVADRAAPLGQPRPAAAGVGDHPRPARARGRGPRLDQPDRLHGQVRDGHGEAPGAGRHGARERGLVDAALGARAGRVHPDDDGREPERQPAAARQLLRAQRHAGDELPVDDGRPLRAGLRRADPAVEDPGRRAL